MADLTLPTPNKTPGDGSPADDTNLIIEAINTLNSSVENLPTMKAGGSSGYVLAKASNADYDTEWIPSGAAPPVSSVDGRTGVVTLSDLYDPAGSASAVDGDLTTHEGLTTSVHGISDTANLVYTSDSRLSDARTPTAHATSHENGGSDELELAPSQVTGTAIVTNDVHLISFVTSGTRPGSPTEGQVIYETDTDTYFGWKGSSWLPIGGGATGGDTDDVFYENSKNVTTSYTLTTGKNAMTAGPVEIDSGATVTIPSGSNWVVV